MQIIVNNFDNQLMIEKLKINVTIQPNATIKISKIKFIFLYVFQMHNQYKFFIHIQRKIKR